MELSVVIPCFNAVITIAVQLEALANQCWNKPWEIVVVDNGSTDDTVEIVKQYQQQLPHLRLVQAHDRQGVSHARNVGVQAATGRAIAFCDADDEVAADWVAIMGEALSQYDFVAGRFEYQKLNEAWLLNSHTARPQESGLSTFAYAPYLPYAGGGNLGIKRWLHQAVGGFNESLCYGEDTDYCFRVQMTGTQLHFVPESVLHCRLRHRLSDIFYQGLHWGSGYLYLRQLYGTPLHPFMVLKYLFKTGSYLPKGLLELHSKKSLAQWLWELGWRLGLLQESIRSLQRLIPAPQISNTSGNHAA